MKLTHYPKAASVAILWTGGNAASSCMRAWSPKALVRLSFSSGTGFQPVKPTGWKPVPLRLPRVKNPGLFRIIDEKIQAIHRPVRLCTICQMPSGCLDNQEEKSP
jgi:hypothetical protein